MSQFIPHSWRVRAALGAIVALLVAFLVVEGLAYGRVAPGTHVGDVRLSWVSKREAMSRLRAAVARRSLLVARLQTPDGKQVLVALDQLGIGIDIGATVNAALKEGRAGASPLRVWLAPGSGVTPVITCDVAAFRRGLEQLHTLVDKPAHDARLRLVGGHIAVAASRDGLSIDEIALQRAIVGRLSAWRPFAGAIPTLPVAPQVTTGVAQERASLARDYIRLPLTVRFRATAHKLSSAEMAGMLAVNTGADAAQQPLTFDNPTAKSELHRLFAAVERQPVDAQVTIVGGHVKIGQSSDGYMIDMPSLISDLDYAVASNGLRQVFVAMIDVPPKLSTSDVYNMGLSGLGSQFTTYFDPQNKARATNLTAAARLVDGTIVKPGQVFSLNAAMGPRTINRGFDYAPVIASDGVLRQGVGGGICQYATTLFNAVFFAGLPVVERHAHSLYIEHYPVGRDATVSWGSADFKFRNDSDKALMIRSWTDNGSLTVVIVGTTGRQVTYTTSAFFDTRQPSTSRAHPRIVYDGDLSRGITRWETGIAGRSVKVVRTVTKGGVLLFRDTFASTYQPSDWIERVGTR